MIGRSVLGTPALDTPWSFYPTMLLSCLFTVLCSAELLITRKDAQPLETSDDQEVIALHHRLMKVQWPTVLAYANKTDDVDYEFVKMFLECIKNPQGRNCSLLAGQAMVASSQYQIRWIPDTIFQVAVEKYYEYQGDSDEHKFIKALNSEGDIPESAVNFDTLIDKAKGTQEFFDQCIAFSQQQLISSIHLKTLKWIDTNYGGRSDWDKLVEDLLKLETGVKPKSKYMSLGLDVSKINLRHAPILKAYILHEVKTAQRGMFILSRGSSSITVTCDQQPFKAFDFCGPNATTSFSQRIMDGSLSDRGVRSLSYLYDTTRNFANPGYMLVLSMAEYIQGFLARIQQKTSDSIGLFNVLYLPALSTAASLLARGELGHPRTKAEKNADHPRGFWGVIGAKNIWQLDRQANLSIFREPVFKSSELSVALLNLLSKAEMIFEESPIYKQIIDAIKGGQVELGKKIEELVRAGYNLEGVKVESSDLNYYLSQYALKRSAENLKRLTDFIAPVKFPDNNTPKPPSSTSSTSSLSSSRFPIPSPPPPSPSPPRPSPPPPPRPTPPSPSPSPSPSDSSSYSSSSSSSSGGSSSPSSPPSTPPPPPQPPVVPDSSNGLCPNVWFLALLPVLII